MWRRVICVRTSDLTEINTLFCAGLHKPDMRQPCNTQTCSNWATSRWSEVYLSFAYWVLMFSFPVPPFIILSHKPPTLRYFQAKLKYSALLPSQINVRLTFNPSWSSKTPHNLFIAVFSYLWPGPPKKNSSVSRNVRQTWPSVWHEALSFASLCVVGRWTMVRGSYISYFTHVKRLAFTSNSFKYLLSCLVHFLFILSCDDTRFKQSDKYNSSILL